MRKIIISIIVSALSIMPFSYSIKAYEQDLWVISAYKYFENHGLNITMEYQNYLDLRLPNFTFTQYYGVPNSDYKYEVYSQGNNGYLGDYISSSNGNIYYKVNGETGVRNCNNCYILLNNTASSGIGQSNTTINSGIPNHSVITEKEDLFRYVRGRYNTVNSYDDSRNSRFEASENEHLHLIFAVVKPNDNDVILANRPLRVNLILNDGDIALGTQLSYSYTRSTYGTTFVYDIEIWSPNNQSAWFDLEITTMNNIICYNLIPIFFGYPKYMQTELYTQLYGNPFINSSDSSDAVDNADNINDEFQNANDNFDNLEADFSSNMNTSLNAIDTNLNVNNLSGFVYGANWVKTQFDFMINNYEPIELLVTYSLILGLALLLLGKRLL